MSGANSHTPPPGDVSANEIVSDDSESRGVSPSAPEHTCPCASHPFPHQSFVSCCTLANTCTFSAPAGPTSAATLHDPGSATVATAVSPAFAPTFCGSTYVSKPLDIGMPAKVYGPHAPPFSAEVHTGGVTVGVGLGLVVVGVGDGEGEVVLGVGVGVGVFVWQ